MTTQSGFFIELLGRIGRIVAIVLLPMSHVCAAKPMLDEGFSAYWAGDMTTAYQLWKPLAERGDAEAQFALGSLYYDGMGVSLDHAASSYWFHMAAKQGLAQAQFNLGNAYMRGDGVARNAAVGVH